MGRLTLPWRYEKEDALNAWLGYWWVDR